MARVLIVGCGCRGCRLARELRASGHVVRGTTRDPRRLSEIEASGAQAFVADPNRVASLAPALDGVAVVCLLLGSASGENEDLAALHGSRLEMLLLRVIDTAVRGLVYEASGSVDPDLLRRGAEAVRGACAFSRIPHSLLAADTAEHDRWLSAALQSVGRLLGTGSSP